MTAMSPPAPGSLQWELSKFFFCLGLVLFYLFIVVVLFSDSVKTNHICFDCVLNKSQGLRYRGAVELMSLQKLTPHPDSLLLLLLRLH